MIKQMFLNSKERVFNSRSNFQLGVTKKKHFFFVFGKKTSVESLKFGFIFRQAIL